MTITVLYFNVLRQATGCGEEEFDVSADCTAGEARDAVMDRSPALSVWKASTRLTVNEEWVKADRVLKEGDRLGLLPPVSGG